MERWTRGSPDCGEGAAKETTPIDHGHLSRYTLGDRALEREVLALFRGQSGTYLEGLRKAETLSQWSLAAHSLKGSAKAVGAMRVADAAADAEALAAIDSEEGRARCLQRLEAAIDEANRYIGRLP